MQSTAHDFNDNVDAALADPNLQDSLSKLKVGFSERRRQAAERLPEFEALRDRARDIKNHALANLDFYLEEFERKVIALGGHVHWAPAAEDARRIIGELCQSVGARTVAKSKSMVAEEIALNEHLEALGIAPIETDLGEYIIQLRHEPPSHIIAPAVHLTKDQVADTFLEHHSRLGFTKRLTERNDLVAEARYVLRQKFLDADVGLTGANFLVAETGSVDAGDQRGQRRSLQHPAAHAHRAGQHREGDPHPRGRRRPAARAGALGDGAGIVGLHDAQHRPEAAGRPRRARALSRRHPRQRPLRGAGHRDAGHAALHPLRRLHEPLPGLRRHRRPRLWLGLSRPDRRGADAAADRRRGGAAICPMPRPSAAAARASARCASRCPA